MMILSLKQSLLALLASSVLAGYVTAETWLPDRGENLLVGTPHHYATQVIFQTSKPLDLLGVHPRERLIVEEALIRACNVAHPSDKLVMNQASSILAPSDDGNVPMALRGSTNDAISDSFAVHLTVQGTYIVEESYMFPSRDKDGDRLEDQNDDNLEHRHALWEESLCTMLARYEAFKGAHNCQIFVDISPSTIIDQVELDTKV